VKRIFIHLALAIIICSGSLILINQRGKADIAPPPMPPGSDFGPTVSTQVRMLEEHVQMDIFDARDIDPNGDLFHHSKLIARVNADFRMKNTGKSAENLEVRFPLGTKYQDQYNLDYFAIPDFQVMVDSHQSIYRKEENYHENSFTNSNFDIWAVFSVNFPVDKEVNISVTYSVASKYIHGNPLHALEYIFHTGSGWKGTIGKAVLVVNLPYANSQDSVMGKPDGGKIDGSSITWVWNEFEPTEKDDFKIVLVEPEVWDMVLAGRRDVERNPKDGAAWTWLGRWYSFLSTFYYNGFGPYFSSLAEVALHKAIEVSPYDRNPYLELFNLYYQQDKRRDLIRQNGNHSLSDPPDLTQAECDLLAYDLNQALLRTVENPDPEDYDLIQANFNYQSLSCPNKPNLTIRREIFPTLTASPHPSPTFPPTKDPILVPTLTAYLATLYTYITPIPTETIAPTLTIIPSVTLPPTYTPLPTKTINASRTSTKARTQMPLLTMSASPQPTVQPSLSRTNGPTNPDNPWLGGIGILVLISVGLGLIFWQRLQGKS